MNYIEIVNDALQYIESNLHRKLRLEELASRYYLSPMHFYHIFRTVTNQTLKTYILERRLSQAAMELKKTDRKIVDIAFQYGFNSHEQFTRNFLEMFHTTPKRYRKENIRVSLIDKKDIIERDFKNENKDLIVDYSCREIKEIKLLGKELIIHSGVSCELDDAIRYGYEFEEKYYIKGTARRLFYIINRCQSDSLRISCFYGIAAEEYPGDQSDFEERVIPASKYAIFKYPEIFGMVYRTVEEDLYRWASVTKFKLNRNTGIVGFILQTEDYKQTGKFYLYIPVL